MKRKIADTIGILCLLFIMWFTASIIDVDLHNDGKHGNMGSWNMFVIMFEED